MVAFPLVKLGVLFFKQISKPIANIIKNRAKSHPWFRRYVCMPPAQIYHWMDVNVRLRMLGLGKAKEVRRLSEEIAVDLGSEMLGEFIIFSVAAAAVYYEYQRQWEKEAKKEALQEKNIKDLQRQVCKLECTIEEQTVEVKELTRHVEEVKTRLKMN